MSKIVKLFIFKPKAKIAYLVFFSILVFYAIHYKKKLYYCK